MLEGRVSSSVPQRRCSLEGADEEMAEAIRTGGRRWLLYVLSTPAGPVGPHALTDSVQLTASPAGLGQSRASCGAAVPSQGETAARCLFPLMTYIVNIVWK